MKKFILAAFLLTVFGSVLFAQQWWGVTNREGGRPIANNTITLARGNSYVYFYFNDEIPRANYNRVRIDFTVDNPISLYWMCAYTPNQVWGAHRGGTNRTTWNYTGLSSGFIETDMSHLTNLWHDGTRVPFSKNEVTGMCIEVNATARTVLTITNVSFL